MRIRVFCSYCGAWLCAPNFARHEGRICRVWRRTLSLRERVRQERLTNTQRLCILGKR